LKGQHGETGQGAAGQRRDRQTPFVILLQGSIGAVCGAGDRAEFPARDEFSAQVGKSPIFAI
jgi:hypothetical protein